MLRNFGDGCKLSDAKCPRCGTAGNFARHACYTRSLVTAHGEVRLVIERVRCLSCRSTHALIPPDVIPYKVYSISLYVAVACEWVDGEPLSAIQDEYQLPDATFLRMLRTIRDALTAALATPSDRASLGAALEATDFDEIAAWSLRVRRACIFENVRLIHRRHGRTSFRSGFT